MARAYRMVQVESVILPTFYSRHSGAPLSFFLYPVSRQLKLAAYAKLLAQSHAVVSVVSTTAGSLLKLPGLLRAGRASLLDSVAREFPARTVCPRRPHTFSSSAADPCSAERTSAALQVLRKQRRATGVSHPTGRKFIKGRRVQNQQEQVVPRRADPAHRDGAILEAHRHANQTAGVPLLDPVRASQASRALVPGRRPGRAGGTGSRRR